MTDTVHWPPDKWPAITTPDRLHRCPLCRALVTAPDRQTHAQWHNDLEQHLVSLSLGDG